MSAHWTFRLRYWRRRFWRFLGRCPDCHTRLNYTPFGRGICPECGH